MSGLKHIGLTGNIGSGKSTVAKFLRAKGAALIDSDELARAATRAPEVLKEIAERLGQDLVGSEGLNRQKTADLVFSNPDALRTLNAIVHPWVRQKSQELVLTFLKQEPAPKFIIHDVPLLFENNLEATVDAIIVVYAPLALRLKRVQDRSGLSEEDIRARDSNQMSAEEKLKKADFIVRNDGSLEALETQLERLWDELKRLA